jgi:hypothetical protein
MIKSAATKAFDFPTSDSLSGQLILQDRGTGSAPEQELTVQIRDINGIHINNVNIPESS